MGVQGPPRGLRARSASNVLNRQMWLAVLSLCVSSSLALCEISNWGSGEHCSSSDAKNLDLACCLKFLLRCHLISAS